jgi:EpsI family protein
MAHRRAGVAVAVLLVGLALAVALPRPVLNQVPPALSALPERFGEWRIDPSVVPISPSPDVQAKLDSIYDQVLARTYVDGQGRRVMLSIAYGGDQRDALQAHMQEACYRAQGFRISGLEQVRESIAGGELPVARMLATSGRRSEAVMYWLTMGDRVVTHRGQRLLVQLSHGLLEQRIPDGLMVRVSSLGTDKHEQFAVQRAFLDAMMASLPRRDARILLGRGA